MNNIAERVSNSFRPAPDSGVTTVQSRAYTASLVPNGFSFHPTSYDNPAHSEFHTRFVGTDTRTAFRADESNPHPSEWKVAGNTAQRLISEEMGLVEHLQASDEGIELSWIFTENPKITSETIQIETTITGMSYTGSTNSGHHFADSQGIDRIRIGQTLIVDSRGKTALLTSTIIDDYLQIKIPTRFLDQALYPVAVDPTISAEMGTDQPVLTIAPDDQENPTVAFDGSTFLVVWEDDRSSSGPDVYGSIVSASRGGVGQANTAIPVSTAANRQRDPVVAGNGILNLVVWQDNRIQSLEDIYGVRVDASGMILDTEGLPISIATNSQSKPAVASNGTDFLVVWQDTRISFSNLEIYAARVQSDGNLPDPDGIRVTDSSFSQRNPTVAGLDTTYMVAWEDLTNGSSNSDILGTRISVQGILMDDAPIEISTVGQKQRTPSAAAGAELFFIVWADTRDDSLDDIFGVRVTEQGNNLDPEGISIATGSISLRIPRITFDGEEFFAAWVQRGLTTSFDIFGSPVGLDGQVLEPDGIAISVIAGSQSEVALASNGATVMRVWTDTSLDPSKDIRGTWISRDTRSIPDDPLSYSVSDAVVSKPSIGITTDGYLAAYEVVRADGFSRIELRQYRSPNFPPELTEIEDQETIANFAVLQIPFTVTDDETPLRKSY
ncbi:MAG TPA: hypothetical protein EYG38_13675 [Verrucomicrobia bacterium]|nr:hypothetical protein [Verrucomicrobiota bacterium]